MNRSLLRSAIVSIILAASVMVGVGSSETKDLSVSGYSFWQIGQIVSGTGNGHMEFNIPDRIPRQWTNNVLVGLRLESRPCPQLKLVISPEFNINYSYPEMPTKPETKRPFGGASINEANGVFSFGDVEKPFLQATLGMFVFKYNSQARHFGDYLFRTGTFPTYVITDFDFPAARLLGLNLSSNYIDNLQCNLLLTSEAFFYPLYDFSLSGIASYKLFNTVEIGAGVNFACLLPADPGKTSPRFDVINRPSAYNQFLTSDGSTDNFYSFKATKVMGKISVDPKAPFSDVELFGMFGKEDLKLYGEVVAVGVGSGYEKAVDFIDTANNRYFSYYNNLSSRTIDVIGFNIPAFKILDVLSMEWEYFPSIIPNDYFNQLEVSSPIPMIFDKAAYNPNAVDHNGWWRWSFYAKKQVISGFSVTALAAFDHMRTNYWDGSPWTYDFMQKKGNWHWNLKFGYSF